MFTFINKNESHDKNLIDVSQIQLVERDLLKKISIDSSIYEVKYWSEEGNWQYLTLTIANQQMFLLQKRQW